MFKQALILAGGKGTRLMPLTKDLPKPMVQVQGKPFLFWQLDYLRNQGVTSVTLLVSYRAEVIIDYFSKFPMEDLEIRFAFEKEPLGTGGALAQDLDILPEVFWLLNGDSYLPANLPAMAQFFNRRNFKACIATMPSHEIGVPGNMDAAAGDRVTEYKKDATAEDGLSLVDAGLYLISKSVVSNGKRGRFDLGELWPGLIQAETLGHYPVEKRYFDIGTIERLKIFEDYVLKSHTK